MTFIKNLENDNGAVKLIKFDSSRFSQLMMDPNYDNYTKVCFLDLETTGLDKKEDKIIELALKIAAIDKETGQLIGIIDEYQSFDDPEDSIDEKVTKINGISNAMVKDQSIDWNAVSTIIDQCDIIVAHNASFDRSFMDRYLPLSGEKLWACSINDIDWLERGFSGSAQELLCMWHGFYYQSHRAMSDVDALINLVAHKFYDSNTPVQELIVNAYKPVYKISALKSPFETKDKLKARKYIWNGDKKYWWKVFQFDEIDEEKGWLANNIYEGSFIGSIEELLITDKYK